MTKPKKEVKTSVTGLAETTLTDDDVRIVRIPKRKPVDVQKVYDETYIPNMEKRGIEAKPYDEWVRKIKTPDGEKVVSGDTGESKEEKGTRLLTSYFNDVIKSLDRIKNLSSPQYKLSEKQIELLNDKLFEKVTEIENVFAGTVKEQEKVDFSNIE